jgi:hypothetical protein
VDQVVHDDEPPGGGRVLGERVEGVQQHGQVVIPENEDTLGTYVRQRWLDRTSY